MVKCLSLQVFNRCNNIEQIIHLIYILSKRLERILEHSSYIIEKSIKLTTKGRRDGHYKIQQVP